MNKKYWWIIIAIVIILLGSWYLNRETAEYSEITTERPYKGNPEASVVIVEYSDFQCPACRSAQSVLESIMDKYPDKVKLEYHNFPLTSIHKYAYKAAEAALCAHDQGDFWGYHDMLFSYQDDLTYSDLESYAGVLDLDVEIWNDCMSTHTKKYVIEEDLDEVYRLGLNSTPTFFLNGQKIGNWGELPSLVEGLVEPLVSLENDSQDDIQE